MAFAARAFLRNALPYLPFLTGAILLSLGFVKLFGLPVRRLPIKASVRQYAWRDHLVFGFAYGLGASGCNLPIFLGVLSYALLGEGAGSPFILLAYSLGVTLPIIAIGMVAFFVGAGALRVASRLSGPLHLLAGLGMIFAGGYMIYFGAQRL